jgi:hypothetical protein
MIVRFARGILWAVVLCGLYLPALAAAAEEGNSPPAIKPVPRQYVLEGEELIVTITATDGNGEEIELGTSSRPQGALFTDKGDGTAVLTWRPDYTGPNSSEGSPFELTFWASDGSDISISSTEVVVINNNRKPYIVAPGSVEVWSGEELAFQVTGYDPDFDSLSWETLEGPTGLDFYPGNPGLLGWATSYSDSGLYDLSIRVSDRYGAADTASIVVTVLPTTVYALSADTVEAYPREVISVDIDLENLEAIFGFNLLINYDVSALTLSSVSAIGTRVEYFEYFSFRLNDGGVMGDVRILGTADVDDGPVTEDLAPGSGPIAELGFHVTGDISFGGFAIPINFVFRDYIEQEDNTLIDPLGGTIVPEQIVYANGFVRIREGNQNRLGDINLNGVPYEIGDVIYYTNYFIDPIHYPLDQARWLNSDVNQDGYAGTVADLVYMVNRLIGLNQPGPKLRVADEVVRISAGGVNDVFALHYSSEMELGAVAVTLESTGDINTDTELCSDMEKRGMIVKSGTDGNYLRILIYSEDGRRMPSGLHELLRIENKSDFEIKEIQLSSAFGQVLRVGFDDDFPGILPDGYRLHQNCPNPFNPMTEIRFDLPEAAAVRLSVYNVLGQEIRRLTDEMLPAGAHLVTWDGRDERGRAVSSGIYLYRLSAGGFSAMKKMLLLK